MALNKNKVIAAAQRFAQRGQFDRAISELRTIVEEDPEDVRVWHRIADLQIRKGSVPQAVATYTRIANFYSERGFFLKGVAVYKQILNADPALVDAHRKLGELYVKLGLGPEAISQFQIVVGTCEREGRHDESLDLLKKIVELGPDDESNRIRLAEAYARQSANDDAIEQFKLTLGQLRDKRRYDEYSQVAERLLYLYPDELDVVRALSEIYLERNDAKRALARLQTLFRADPSDPGTLSLLARAFTAIGQTAKAISVYRELARIHGESGNAQSQADAWAQLLTLDPDDPEALEATGSVGPVDAPIASGAYSTAGLAPTTGEQADDLLRDVELLLKYSLKEHARERLDKVFEIDAYHEGALLKLKELALADERTDEAADALMRLAEGAEQAGDPQKAMSWLGAVIQLRPGDPIAADAMRRISSSMAQQLASNADPSEASGDYDGPADYDVDLGEIDFDDASLVDEPVGDGFDLDLGELDASVDDEFAEFMSDDPPAPIDTGAVITPPPPADDAFGDLLADDPPPSDDAFGDLLADDPPPSDDAFGDLLADDPPAPAPEDDFGDLLADDAPAPEDDFGDLLADDPPAPAPEDDFGDLLADDPPAPAPASEDDFDGLLADDPPAPAPEDDFGDLLADDPPAPMPEDDFGDLLTDEPAPTPEDDDFGDLLAGDPPASAEDLGAVEAPVDAPAVLVLDPPPTDDLGDLDLGAGDDDGFDDLDLDADGSGFASSAAEATPAVEGFVADLPAREDLPDEDEFADLLLDGTGSEAEPDFGLYESINTEQLGPPGERLPPVSGAPAEVDIDIDVSMDMPEIDFERPVVSEPTPEPVSTELPPPPPPPNRAVAPPPPPPPPPKLPAPEEDDLDDIEELDLDEIIELDDDDLLLEDDSIDESLDDSSVDDSSVGDSSADSSISLDGSSDGSVEEASQSGEDKPSLDLADLSAAESEGDALDSDDDSADLESAGLESDGHDDADLDLDLGSDDSGGLDLDLDLGSDDSGDADLDLGSEDSGDVDLDLDSDALDLDSDLDLDLGSADDSIDRATAASGDGDIDTAAERGAEPADAPETADDLAEITADHAIPELAEQTDDDLAAEPPALEIDDSGDTEDVGEAPSLPEPTDEPETAPETAPDVDEPEPTESAPDPAIAARPRSIPRPPGLGAASLKLDTGLPSAPKPLTASSLSLGNRATPTPPKPAAPMKPVSPPPATPEADDQALLHPPAPAIEQASADDADDTIAVNVSAVADMFESDEPEPSLTDQTEAGELAHDTSAPQAATTADLEEELAEIDFLIESNLLDDAQELLRELRTQYPDHPGLLARTEKIESPSPFGDDDDFLSGLTDDFDLDFGEVKGAELSDLGDDEADTHFDLGLAFKEMGQYKKAIAELELAARRSDKRAEALRIIALCHAEQGASDLAVETLRKALDTPDLPLNARAGLQYDLANLYEQLGQTDQARAQFESIVAAGMDDFLDVKARLAALES